MKLCVECRAPIAQPEWTCALCGWKAAQEEGIPLLAGVVPEGEGYSKAFFQELADWEARHFWFTSRNLLLQWALKKHASRMASFLEVGCGTGFVLQGLAARFPAARFTGAELHPEGLPFASARLPNATFLQLDARTLPFVDEFDAIGLFDVLEHIPEDVQVLTSVASACKPGGVVMLTVPQHPWLWSVVDENAYHVRRYTRKQLLEGLAVAGLQPRLVTSFVTLLLPVMAMSRSKRDRQKKAFDGLAEFRISRWKNGLLEWILGIERGLIKLGIRWPWGGSLLVVASKPGPSANSGLRTQPPPAQPR